MTRPEGYGSYNVGAREQEIEEQARPTEEEELAAERRELERRIARLRNMPSYCGICGRELAARETCPACGDGLF